MSASPTLDAQLRHLEEQLLRPDVRRATEKVAALLADGFVEFASSGQVFDRRQILDALQHESPAERSLSDFHCTVLAENIALVTYRATRLLPSDAAPAHSLRSSIWRLKNGQWQMVFHQGTLVT